MSANILLNLLTEFGKSDKMQCLSTTATSIRLGPVLCMVKGSFSKVKDIEDLTLLEYSPSNGTLLFGNNIKSKMGILNLIRKIYFHQKP